MPPPLAMRETPAQNERSKTMLTRKHFQRVADIIRESEISGETEYWLVEEFSTFFEEENERFDAEKFAEACGI